MDELKHIDANKPKKKHPFDRANVITDMFFCWMLPYFVKGFKKELTEDDMYGHLECHESSKLGNKLEKAWEYEVTHKKNPSLWIALLKVFKFDFGVCVAGLLFLEYIPKLSYPLLLSQFLKFFEPSQPAMEENEAYIYAGLLVLTTFTQVMVTHRYMVCVLHLGMKIRVAICSLIYRKALKLSKSALVETTIGQMVNLLTNDVARFEYIIIFINYLWMTPIQATIFSYVLYSYVGYTGLIGICFLLLFTPVQLYMSKKTSHYRLRTALRTDERVRLMSEIINGIQVIKMYTWEKPFAKLVELSRKKEMHQIKATSVIRAIMFSLNLVMNGAAIYFCILTYVLTGNTITASYVYTVSSFYGILRDSVTKNFPKGLTDFAEANVSAKRIQKFLSYDEIKSKNDPWENHLKIVQPKVPQNGSNGVLSANHKNKEVGVSLKNVSIKWVNSLPENTLNNISFNASSNQLVAVVGPVGGGKTTLLHAILQELLPTEGVVDVQGTISYASQEPWLFGGSIRQNIVFGQKFEAKKYAEVIRVCALERDFTLFPYGDRTHVGDRGVTLSGGQRARINLARAVYKDADIYLLDDPLSAVDAHVGKQIFDQCIRGYLRNSCVILVTHQLQYLKTLQSIYLLEDGRVTASGSYRDMQSSASQFTKLLKSQDNDEDKPDRKSMQAGDKKEEEDSEQQAVPQEEKEQRGSGIISWKVYKSYFRAGGNCCKTVVVLFSFILSQFLSSSTDYFVNIWVNVEQWRSEHAITPFNDTFSSQNNTNPNVQNSVRSFLNVFLTQQNAVIIYSFIVFSTAFVTLSRSIYFFRYCMIASTRLHNSMFNKIVYASMRFFNTNPSGRILNRFSKDIGIIDEMLPLTILDTVQVGLNVLAVTLVIGSLNPWTLLPTLAILVIFYYLRVVYLATTRDIKRVESVRETMMASEFGKAYLATARKLRLYTNVKGHFGYAQIDRHYLSAITLLSGYVADFFSCGTVSTIKNLIYSLTRSPIYTHLSASLHGLTTIRAFGAQEILKQEFDNYQNKYSAVNFLYIGANRTFGFWLDFHCVVYIALVIVSILFVENEIFGGNVGLSLTQSITLTGMFQWGMRQWSELETNMTSVERVQEYMDINPEKDEDTKDPPKLWPEHGDIEFRNMCLRYSKEEQYVLQNLNFKVKGREKVGIVGRTGAGKSSLIAALFRLTGIDGSILIDGVDTKTVPLTTLRSKISIIPQEPVLFSGTLRKNLDPFDEFNDEVLWDALYEVELKSAVSDLPAGLDSKISEGGSNFSVGQRQLLCLARAIIRNNKILVLDEATANVDPHTDGLIQSTIRRKFADCTVLTIAHRLHTIMDSDKVLVMDAGRAVEFDHPHKLLQNPNGVFYGLVIQTGQSMTKNLTAVAQENFKNAIL